MGRIYWQPLGDPSDASVMPAMTVNPASVALVLPGEAMWGALQTGFVFELGSRLERAGWGRQPFQLAIGSSSGSLIAAAAAAGGPFDHEFGRAGWIEFGQVTKFRARRPLNPYPEALQKIFEGGLVNAAKAFHSRTELVVTASHYRGNAAAALRRDHARLFAAGLHLFLTGDNPGDASKIL
jgi:predicted acylesterase/phospholipase RssA